MFDVYVIVNNRNKKYIGYTSNLENRIKRHNNPLKNKLSSYTSKNKSGEWVVVYKEEFTTRKEAMVREKELKSFRGRKFIEKLINNK